MNINAVGTTQVYGSLASSGAGAVSKAGDGDRDDGTAAATPTTTGAASQIMQQLGIGRNIDITG